MHPHAPWAGSPEFCLCVRLQPLPGRPQALGPSLVCCHGFHTFKGRHSLTRMMGKQMVPGVLMPPASDARQSLSPRTVSKESPRFSPFIHAPPCVSRVGTLQSRGGVRQIVKRAVGVPGSCWSQTLSCWSVDRCLRTCSTLSSDVSARGHACGFQGLER